MSHFRIYSCKCSLAIPSGATTQTVREISLCSEMTQPISEVSQNIENVLEINIANGMVQQIIDITLQLYKKATHVQIFFKQ